MGGVFNLFLHMVPDQAQQESSASVKSHRRLGGIGCRKNTLTK